jgi:serine/threonine protein kinase
VKSKLGSGTFGSVEKSIWRKNGKLYAVKSIDNVGLMNVDKIQEEANNMLRTSSDYTLELVDHFHDQT